MTEQQQTDKDFIDSFLSEVIKTPIAYYGGKQRMLEHIIPIIPKHKIYVEGFFGGGAVFFAKDPSDVEVINDLNDNVINFYRVAKDPKQFESLKILIDGTLHSRATHKKTSNMYKKPDDLDPITKAWCFWIQANMSFGHVPMGGWAFSKNGQALNTHNKKQDFTIKYCKRLENTHVESSDILYLIDLWDSEDTFFYLDPPYVSSDCGSYKGYTTEDFKNLLDKCSVMKGKFLMSSYPEEILMEYRNIHKWQLQDIEKTLSVDGRRKEQKKKIECLTYNYDPYEGQLKLF